MQVFVTGGRTGAPAYFDMARRCMNPGDERWYGVGFRMGDRAFAHCYVREWRLRNPGRRLVFLEDSVSFNDIHFARHLPATWFIGSLADEIRVAERPHEPMDRPEGERLYVTDIRRLWAWVRRNRSSPPAIRPPEDAFARAAAHLDSLPRGFATVQPLVDAEHTQTRNGRPEWWERVIRALSAQFPLAVVGASRIAGRINLPRNVTPVFDLDPLAALAVISRSCVHVGGETGFTIWSSVFGRPTVGCYRPISVAHPLDVKPIDFAAPAPIVALGSDPAAVVAAACGIAARRRA